MAEFASNSATKNIPSPPPPIWAHLHTIEKWSPFCGNDPAAFTHTAPTSYDFEPSVDEGERKPYRRFRNAAEAIALISADKKDAQSVSACAIELQIDAATGAPKYVVTIARNGGFDEEASSTVLQLLKETAAQVDLWEWADESADDAINRRNKRADISRGMLQSIIVHCRLKLLDTLTSVKATACRTRLREWVADKAKGDDKVSVELGQALIHTCLTTLATESKITPDELPRQLSAAYVVARSPLLEAMSSEVQSFIKRLARYPTATATLVKTFIDIKLLHKTPAASLFDVVAINTTRPESILTCAADSNEPSSFEDYLTVFDLTSKDLIPQKIDQVRDTWCAARSRKTSFLHAELQLALFYIQNPERCPLGGFIGVSKKCCHLCDFVLKHFQKDASDPNYPVHKTGSPTLFSVAGTHGGITQNWRFPDPDQDVFSSTFPPLDQQRLRNRLRQIRLELSVALQAQVQKMLKHVLDITKNRRGEESDGSGESDSDQEEWRWVVQTLE
ncbi:hypothetical protein C8J57DRAFT_1267541 [Mycena rebaudengoi]|nr:hypothetical protein C8J57DRAFT_1267541 [Mycena rebaudengoi]